MLAFPDRLRSSEADRRLYERVKQELAARRWKYVQNYADAKSDVVKLIFDSWGRVAARKLLILLVWGTDFSKM